MTVISPENNAKSLHVNTSDEEPAEVSTNSAEPAQVKHSLQQIYKDNAIRNKYNTSDIQLYGHYFNIILIRPIKPINIFKYRKTSNFKKQNSLSEVTWNKSS